MHCHKPSTYRSWKMWSLFNRFPVSNHVLILKSELTFDAIATYRAVVGWRGWWTAQFELEAIRISGGRIITWTHHKRCKTQYEYSKMNLLSVIANLDPMAYRAIDGVAPEKSWKTKKHSFKARTRRGERIKTKKDIKHLFPILSFYPSKFKIS